jgi:hypothetical protein
MSIYSPKLTSCGRAALRCEFVWRRRISIGLTMAGVKERIKPEHLKLNPQLGGSHAGPRGDGDQQLFGDHGIHRSVRRTKIVSELLFAFSVSPLKEAQSKIIKA